MRISLKITLYSCKLFRFALAIQFYASILYSFVFRNVLHAERRNHRKVKSKEGNHMICIVGESNNKYGRHDIRNLPILFNLQRLSYNFNLVQTETEKTRGGCDIQRRGLETLPGETGGKTLH